MAQSPGSPYYALDRGSELPLGTQLAWRLRSVIASGRLAEGDRLPGVREMAALAGVNVNTVRSVYGRLADEGAIVSEHGRGTFVADRRAAEAELDRVAAAFGGPPRAEGRERVGREARGAAEHAPAGRGATHEARRRATLRAEIAMLERELAAIEVPTNGETREAPDPRDRPTPQLLTADDLETIRDHLVERLQPLRADRAVARDQRERERHEATRDEIERPTRPSPTRQRAIATTMPKFETGSGGWSLRWRG
ncbi:MAG TPA: GntR family transcriptional regulator [Thermoleophilaceae bacterium]|jgi:DNA-binding transcriptional regulator YhcF (GntR family)